MPERSSLARLEERLVEQLRKDQSKPSRRLGVEDDGTIRYRPSGSAEGLAIAIEHITGEDDAIGRLENT